MSLSCSSGLASWLHSLGEQEAKFIERPFQASVDYVVRNPAASEKGRIARRDLIGKPIEFEECLSTLLRAAVGQFGDSLSERRA